MRIFVLVFFLLIGCTEPIDFSLKTPANLLVVEGLLTDAAGPHEVRLSRTTDYAGTLEGGARLPVSGAVVVIKNHAGGQVVLQETAAGRYVTDSTYKGVVGNTYSLYVQLPDGKEYVSAPEYLQHNSSFSNLSWQVESREKLNAWDNLVKVKGMHLQADLDFSTPAAYMRFGWKYKKIHLAGTTYVQDINYIKLFNAAENSSLAITDASLLYIEKPLGEADAQYELTLKQYSIGLEAYNFWQSVGKQVNTRGSIFDPAPESITGNIYNMHDPEEKVIGLFSAAGVQIQHVTFTL